MLLGLVVAGELRAYLHPGVPVYRDARTFNMTKGSVGVVVPARVCDEAGPRKKGRVGGRGCGGGVGVLMQRNEEVGGGSAVPAAPLGA